jgi:SAM-dependent methyltransferase
MFDQVGLAAGATCLDAGCGPGETMRLMAQRVGTSGHVTGVDIDAPLGAQAVAMLHDAGHRQCDFARVDLTAGEPIPGAPFDLVYARLLLYHLPQRVEVLRRLWDAVAPGGHLLVQDYDMRSCGVLPDLESIDELVRVVVDAFAAVGCDVHAGTRLPLLFACAGSGAPDGTDVAGRLDPLAVTKGAFMGVLNSVLPAAVAHGVTTEQRGAALLAAVERDAERHPDRPALWPLLIGAWKRKRA